MKKIEEYLKECLLATDVRKLKNLVFDCIQEQTEEKKNWRKYFVAWCKNNGIENLSSGSISNLINGEYKNKALDDEVIYELNEYRGKVKHFLTSLDTYLQEEESEKQYSFENTIWYVYFFYSTPPREQKVKLGRCILHLKNGTATMSNINDGSAKNKIGKFEKHNDAIFIDLHTRGARHEHLHIKINRDSIPSELMLGGFVSKEIRTITVGTLVLQRVFDEDKVLESKALCVNDGDGFKAVPLSIRKFLSRKEHNFTKVPNGIFTDKNLDAKIKSHQKGYQNLFFDTEYPVLYLSSPCTNLAESFNQTNIECIYKLKEQLENEFKTKGLKVIFLEEMNELDSNYHQVLKWLQKTTFYVLIYPEQVVSNALVELGVALTHAKRVFIFAPKSVLPEKIGSFARGSKEKSFYAIEQMKGNDLEKIAKENYENIFKELKKKIYLYFNDEYSW